MCAYNENVCVRSRRVAGLLVVRESRGMFHQWRLERLASPARCPFSAAIPFVMATLFHQKSNVTEESQSFHCALKYNQGTHRKKADNKSYVGYCLSQMSVIRSRFLLSRREDLLLIESNLGNKRFNKFSNVSGVSPVMNQNWSLWCTSTENTSLPLQVPFLNS